MKRETMTEALKKKKQTSAQWPTVPNEHWGLAQDMRKDSTVAEHVLWQMLRGSKLGVKFRRQHPIGPYIADFVSLECRVVIELDGVGHEKEKQIEHDKAREEYLAKRGLRVIRFANEQVLTELDAVVRKIEELIVAAKKE